MLNVCQNTCFWRWCNLRSHGVVPFSEFPMSHFYQKIVCIPIAEIAGVTFFTCWCVEFHGESNPPYKLCVTSAVSSNHYSCYYTIYIYTPPIRWDIVGYSMAQVSNMGNDCPNDFCMKPKLMAISYPSGKSSSKSSWFGVQCTHLGFLYPEKPLLDGFSHRWGASIESPRPQRFVRKWATPGLLATWKSDDSILSNWGYLFFGLTGI